jgi:PadR family transcriptional regulator PadR
VAPHSDAKRWITQARRGTLELCVLTLISQKPRYGYELVACLRKWEQLAATEGTLYPMLSRLHKDGHIAADQWRESESGPPRKYYRLTGAGESLLSAMSSEWTGLTGAIERLQETE